MSINIYQTGVAFINLLFNVLCTFKGLNDEIIHNKKQLII